MPLAVLKERAQMLHDIRAFFYERQVVEVETPALSQAGNTDPSIESFSVNDEGLRYLHTSPEYFMKRLLVAGSGDIYQIAKVWRKSELGRQHNPEFTMLEWYRVGFSYRELMQEVEGLLQQILPNLDKASRILTYQDAFLENLGIDPHSATDAELMLCMQQNIEVMGELDRSAILDILMTHCIEPSFKKNGLTFIYDYPAIQQALSCLTDSKNPVAMRFEVYIGNLELANGYQEQIDYEKNREILQQDAETRADLGLPKVPVDTLFLTAMQRGMPKSAGVALGLDRVLMHRLGKKKLEDILSFPWTVA